MLVLCSISSRLFAVSLCRFVVEDDHATNCDMPAAHFSGYNHCLVLAESFQYRRERIQDTYSKFFMPPPSVVGLEVLYFLAARESICLCVPNILKSIGYFHQTFSFGAFWDKDIYISFNFRVKCQRSRAITC